MNLIDLLKTLAPGFLPLFAYLGAELLFGERVGLFVGIGLGIAEFIFRLVKDRKADYFALAETILLATMGALSLASGNAVYFRLKPAITEGLTALGMAVLLFLPDAILREYFGRQMRGLVFDDAAIEGLRKNLVLILAVLIVHAGLTAWAALAASAAVWGFVSGGLLYILLAAVFVWRVIVSRLAASSGAAKDRGGGSVVEWRILLFDESGKILAARPGHDPERPWACPLGGRAASPRLMQEDMSKGLSGMGFGGMPTLVLRPLFLAPGYAPADGLSVPVPEGRQVRAFNPEDLFRNLPAVPPESRAVFAAVIPRDMSPRGFNPTVMRFWSLSDLLALRDSPVLEPDLSSLAVMVTAYRDSLRNQAPDL